MDTRKLNTWVEISRSAYLHNLAFFRRLLGPNVELSAVVKANAYGHDWRLIAPLALEGGADSFCVHSLDEAVALRSAGIEADVLLMERPTPATTAPPTPCEAASPTSLRTGGLRCCS